MPIKIDPIDLDKIKNVFELAENRDELIIYDLGTPEKSKLSPGVYIVDTSNSDVWMYVPGNLVERLCYRSKTMIQFNPEITDCGVFLRPDGIDHVSFMCVDRYDDKLRRVSAAAQYDFSAKKMFMIENASPELIENNKELFHFWIKMNRFAWLGRRF